MTMTALVVENGKFEVEVLDGQLISVRNSNSQQAGNLAKSEPFSFGRIAFIFGNLDGSEGTVSFNSPGDTSITGSKLANVVQAKLNELDRRDDE